MKTTGGCFCGAIEYTAEIDERQVAICHCTDCQVMSGSAFRVLAPMSPASFELVRGEPRAFDKTADSGNVRRLLFCGDCGTHLAAMPVDPESPGAFAALRVATSRDAASLVPRFELWCDSRVAWLPAFDTRARFDGQP